MINYIVTLKVSMYSDYWQNSLFIYSKTNIHLYYCSQNEYSYFHAAYYQKLKNPLAIKPCG